VVNPYSKTVGLPVPSNFATVYHLFFQYKSTHWTTVLMDLLQCHTQSYESVQNETARANYQAVNETGTHYLAVLLVLSWRHDRRRRWTGSGQESLETIDRSPWKQRRLTGATGHDRQEPLLETIDRADPLEPLDEETIDDRSSHWSHWRQSTGATGRDDRRQEEQPREPLEPLDETIDDRSAQPLDETIDDRSAQPLDERDDR